MDPMTQEALLVGLEHSATELAKKLALTVDELLTLIGNRIREKAIKGATDKVFAERWLESIE